MKLVVICMVVMIIVLIIVEIRVQRKWKKIKEDFKNGTNN